MQQEFFLCTSVLFSITLCSSSGSSEARGHREKTPNLFSDEVYSPQEEQLIIEELEARGIEKYDTSTTWNEIAQEHEKRRTSHYDGFNQERTAHDLHEHFFLQMMKKNRPKDAVKVPDSVKKMFQRKKQVYYTPQEDDFINAELLAYPGTNLKDYKVWRRLIGNLELKRAARAKGFESRRTRPGLHNHFYYHMIPYGRVSPAVIKKFKLESLIKQGRRSKEGTTRQQTDSSQEGSEMDSDFVAEMINELREPETTAMDPDLASPMLPDIQESETSEAESDFMHEVDFLAEE